MRPQQWYKNLVVFAALVFVGSASNLDALVHTAAAFASLCLVSSAGYAINDALDRDADTHHSEKKSRPLPSGKVSLAEALLLAVTLAICGLFVANLVNPGFFYAASVLFFLMLAYSLFFKRVAIADVLAIATNFALRAVSGAVAIGVSFSSWLVLCTFLLGLFLAVSKRHSEIRLEAFAARHRPALEGYSQELLGYLLAVSASMLLIAYSIYVFSVPSHGARMWATIPVALFIVFRFCFFISSGSVIARKPERIVFDLPSLAAIVLWLALAASDIYLH
jgi:4-hydroxybenzoate polyprenyltransferase